MLQFGHVPAARDAESQRNIVIASAVRHGFRRTERHLHLHTPTGAVQVSNPLHVGDCFVAKDAPALEIDVCRKLATCATFPPAGAVGRPRHGKLRMTPALDPHWELLVVRGKPNSAVG